MGIGGAAFVALPVLAACSAKLGSKVQDHSAHSVMTHPDRGAVHLTGIMPRKLKVYRTPIGFHDAYVAAPSQKAALEAWGSDANLFARGVAEIVTDPALTEEPLAHPGEVVRRLRGSADDHFAALPKNKAKRAQKADPAAADEAPARTQPATGVARAEPARKPKAPPKPKPRPSRARLDAAEEALDALEREHRDELAEVRRREEALTKERRAIEERQAREVERLTRARTRARERYDEAIARWRD